MADRVLISCKHVWDVYEGFEPLFAEHGVDVDMPRFEGQQLEEHDLLPIVHRYDGILAGDDKITARVIEAAERLRVIAKWGIGVDGIDGAAAAARGIPVLNTPGMFGDELGDYAVGFLVMMARRLHQVDARVRAGGWGGPRGRSLAGLTVGLVGLGSSGRAFARRVVAMGMLPIGFDVVPPEPGFVTATGCEMVTLDELLTRSDVISLHAPSTPETRHIIGREALARVKRGVWLMNISRGTLVDEGALCEALDDGRVGAAALDVFETEPLAPDHPLTGYDNVILGTHNGSNTHEAVLRTTEQAIRNLLEGLEMHHG